MNSSDKFEQERREMVERQLKARNITSEAVLEAMAKIPREKFVRSEDKKRAYSDMALPIQAGQTISQPYIVALMSQQLNLKAGHRVLEVGTGSGYQTAVLAELGASVCTVEYKEELSRLARQRLTELGYADQVKFKVGDGGKGWPEEAPFDRAIITAAVPSVPEKIQNQLKNGGLIVAPAGSKYSQKLVVVQKKDEGEFNKRELISCRFVPLVGEGGWKDTR
ncbi:MAG: protein-L-isoaspartate(D-aspartate) O-methyltransferase [bacterium]